ncbi:hypothetical protein [Propionivibrio sp.]|uniref:COG4315 family predicted lipoprotein n=1 Tax=Propionivibrio sp. TaxID=2212460 RepID=UPI0039E33B4D
MKIRILTRIALLAAASAASFAHAAPAMVTEGILTGGNGMTLYTFDRDAAGSGKSACNDACAKNWPPLKARDDDIAGGDYSIVMRDDGSKQWAYKGKPLYFWVKDQQPGDKTGDGVNNAWHVVKP